VRILVVALLLSSSGCLFDEVRGIPCGSDHDCPTTYFCDLPHDECRLTTDELSAPDLTVPMVRDPAGAVVLLPKVPAEQTSRLGVQVQNRGAGPAEGVLLSFAPLQCVAFTFPDEPPTVVGGGQTVEFPVDVAAEGGPCSSVKIIDWFLDYSGRSSRGTFDLDITDP
jgi:hypothetical protein